MRVLDRWVISTALDLGIYIHIRMYGWMCVLDISMDDSVIKPVHLLID